MTKKRSCPPSTRDKIIKEAENLFSKYNYNSVSLNDIALKNKITKAAFYYHFKSKEELFVEIIKKAHTNISTKISEILNLDIILEEKFKKIIIASLDINLNSKYLTTLSLQKLSKNDKNITNFVCEFKDEMLNQIEPLMKEILDSCGYPKDTDPKFIAFFLMSSLKGYSMQRTCGNCNKWSNEQFANEIIKIIFRK